MSPLGALLPSLQHLLLLRLFEAVDEEHPIEVVVFVLDGPGKQAIGLDGEKLALRILGLHDHRGGPFDIMEETGDGEPPLVGAAELHRYLYDLRLDEDSFSPLRHIHDEEADVGPDLRGGEADPIGLGHRDEHRIDELRERRIEDLDRFAPFSEYLVPKGIYI